MRRRAFGDLPADLQRGYSLPVPQLERAAAEASAAARALPAPAMVPAAAAQASAVRRINLAPVTFTTVVGSRRVLAANPQRSYLVLQSLDATNTIWLNFGADAGVNRGFRILPGAWVEWYYIIPTGSVHVYAAAAGVAFTVAEG